MDKDYFNAPGYNIPPYFGYDGFDYNPQNQTEANGMYNPFAQYEQAYMYYRYLSQQMDYKIKCKEFERLSNLENTKPNQRKIE